jgi:hypothetical protein
MLRKLLGCVLLLSGLAANAVAHAALQDAAAQVRRLDPKIGPAIPELYGAVQHAKDWKNPYLVVHADGVEVKFASGRKFISAAELERTLLSLPAEAWPYGRVVAVQDTIVRRSDRNDQRLIADNRSAVLAILSALQVTAELRLSQPQ